MKGSVFKRCPCPPETLKKGKSGQYLSCKKDHGTWSYRLDAGIDAETGKRRRPSGSGYQTREQAEDALTKKVAEVNAGIWTDDRSVTVGEYLERWLDRKTTSLKATTIDAYRTHVNLHLKPHLGAVKLRDLRPEHVYSMLDAVADGRSAATVHRVRATLRSALAGAVRERLITWNPARDLEMPKESRVRVQPWEPAEIGAFLDHSHGHRLNSLFHVIAYCGLRRGEGIGLRWDDVDLVKRQLTIRQQIVQINRTTREERCAYCGEPHPGQKFDTPKTDESAGVVHLDATTVSVLLGQQLAQGEERLRWGDAYSDHGLVFSREDGVPLNPNAVSRLFEDLQKDVRVPGPAHPVPVRRIRLHDLRHGTASLMIAAGIDIAIVSKVLRHSTIKLTVDSYGHLLAGVGETAADKRASMIPRKGSSAPVGHIPATDSKG
jgi:integrase